MTSFPTDKQMSNKVSVVRTNQLRKVYGNTRSISGKMQPGRQEDERAL